MGPAVFCVLLPTVPACSLHCSDFCFRRLVLGPHELSLLNHRSYVFVPDFIFVLFSPTIPGTGVGGKAAVSLAPLREKNKGPCWNVFGYCSPTMSPEIVSF